MKIIRNLSQISYRILNYILYVNLFFARIITNKNEFDKYLPRDMKWAEILSECLNLIKNEITKIKNIFLTIIISIHYSILIKFNSKLSRLCSKSLYM